MQNIYNSILFLICFIKIIQHNNICGYSNRLYKAYHAFLIENKFSKHVFKHIGTMFAI